MNAFVRVAGWKGKCAAGRRDERYLPAAETVRAIFQICR